MPPGNNLTLELLQRWNAGDQRALDALLERHLEWVTNLVHAKLGAQLRKREETQDFVQSAMLDFLRDGPRFEVSNEAAFRGLLARIAENNICDRQRHFGSIKRGGCDPRHPLHAAEVRAGSESILDLDARRPVTRPSEHAQRDEEIALVQLALELLGAEDRTVLQLRQFEELTFGEIGERLELHENTARMRFQRALPRLAEKVLELRERGLASALESTDPPD